MNRRQFCTLLGAAPAGAALAQAPRRPNVVLIMADDLGYGDLGCYGQKTIATPNIDRLCAEGMKFTDFYAGATVCAPSRCSLMTGKHGGHATVRGNRNPEVPLRPGDVTIAEMLKTAGYAAAQFGKWGVGGPVTLGRPNAQGFDEFFGYLSQWHAHDHFPGHLWDNEVEHFIGGNRSGGRRTFSHDLFTDKALDFLDRSASAGKPFFLYLPYAVPHTNNELGRRAGDGMEVPHYGSYADRGWPSPEKGFAAMIEFLDRDVGRITDRLDALGLAENTIVFFTSDNGPHREGGHDAEFFGSRGGLRGIKRDLYEGGIRVPMIARWKGAVEAGSVSNLPWAAWDVLATCADLAGVPAPPGTDGISVKPTLLGQAQQGHEYLYWEFHERSYKRAVRMGRWKGVKLAPGAPLELYDLSRDPGETQDAAAANPAVVERIEAILKTARTESKEFPAPGS